MVTSSLCLPSTAFAPKRYKPGKAGHLPFANDLIAALRPPILVELGTHCDESYFGFCQAIVENNVACSAYAVGLGKRGDGQKDEANDEEAIEYNKANYSSFSRLIPGEIDDAASQFEDGSIDLLHIGGLQAFADVSRVFHSWLPKARPGGVILVDEIATGLEDCGASTLWPNLKTQGATFEFPHGSGLGVFEKPGSTKRVEFLETLFTADQPLPEHIRRYYYLSAVELELRHNLSVLSSEHEKLLTDADIKQTRIYLLSDSHNAMKAGQREYAALLRQYEELEENYKKLEISHRQLMEQHASLENTFQHLLSSHSWKLTSPLRAAARVIKGEAT